MRWFIIGPITPYKTQVIRQGEALQVEGPVVIFANEWLDALPSIVCYLAMGSGEKRASSAPKRVITRSALDAFSPAVSAVAHRLPKTAPEGYQLDWPLAAENALTELMACEWSGSFSALTMANHGKRCYKIARGHRPHLSESCARKRPTGGARGTGYHLRHHLGPAKSVP